MTMPDMSAAAKRIAAGKVREAEDMWNLRDLDAVVRSNSIDCQWRHRTDVLWGREQVRNFLSRKWRREIELRVANEFWAGGGRRLAFRFAAEFRDDGGSWFRAHGNENWELDAQGLVVRRITCANEQLIGEHERLFRWPFGVRPSHAATLSELGF